MSPGRVLTDTQLREALTPDAGLRAPAGLLADIAAEIRRRPRRRRWYGWSSAGEPGAPLVAGSRRGLAWAIAAALLLVALFAGALVGAGLIRVDEPAETVRPDAAGPLFRVSGVGRLLAIDDSEAWAADLHGLWHFVDGRWVGPNRSGVEPEFHGPAGRVLFELAVLPGGEMVLGGLETVYIQGEGTWTSVETGPLEAVAGAPDGTIWAAAPQTLRQLEPSGDAWTLRSISCPAGGQLIAVTTDGAVWTGGIGYSASPGLARSDGRSCMPVFPLGGDRLVDVVGLAADPTGGLVVATLEGAYPSSRMSIVRWDGTTWSTLWAEDLPGFLVDMAVGPTGDVWVSSLLAEGLQRYRAGAWKTVVADSFGPISIAPDGTVWYGSSSGVERIEPGDLRD